MTSGQYNGGQGRKGFLGAWSITMMNEIIASAEKFAVSNPDLAGRGGASYDGEDSTEASVAKASVTAARKRNAAAILVLAGAEQSLPRLVAGAYRPDVRIVSLVPS